MLGPTSTSAINCAEGKQRLFIYFNVNTKEAFVSNTKRGMLQYWAKSNEPNFSETLSLVLINFE